MMPTASSVPTTRPTPGSSTTRSSRRGTSWPRRSGGETEVQLREQVVEILQKNGRVQGVRLRSGSVIQSPVVVNAAGPYSGQVNALAGVTGEFRIRTRPLRQEVHSVPAPAGYARGELGPAVTDGDLGTYFRSHFGGQLIVGSAEPECDALHWIDDPDDFEAQPTARAWDSQVLRLARRIPSLGIPPRPVGFAALYDVADDWIPVYDRTSLAGFYVAIGTSGNQFKNAPVAGRFMAALVHACENGHESRLRIRFCLADTSPRTK